MTAADPTCLRNKRILVVEDEMLIALAYEDMLTGLGCVPIGPAPSVERALLLLDDHVPDAAILDGNLNGQLSTPVAQRLCDGNIPFLLVTGYETMATADPVLRHARRVSKPVNPRRLLAEMVQAFCAC
ncbi:response regulator [Rhodospirillum centenum]|uniref:Response regulator receiver domain protein n=1 Tax=Rhodospirillum centenum (strain ATCC 51521 / SW) TaxID=414684 RepID=B6IUF9_RHOCS|nr:response regulator [Rhodospirillum centenum]ACI99784.1 response regulator receiver domain protein [Rhodospirillum centenum SW]